MSASGFDNDWDWYTGGLDSVCSPAGPSFWLVTRWSEKDLTGQLIRQMGKDEKADQWEVVELPAIMDDEEPCWPEFWSKDDLERVKGIYPAVEVERAVSAASYR